MRRKEARRWISLATAVLFSINLILPPAVRAQSLSSLLLPPPGTMVNVTAGYQPLMLIGVTIHPENPLLFDFIFNKGESKLEGEAFREESRKIIKYFLAALTIPEQHFWVNLSPAEPDRIVEPDLGQTETGRDLLAQDYLLKQLTASLGYPEGALGQKFWRQIYAKARQRFGQSAVPLNSFNKVWVTARTADIYQHGASAFVLDGQMKVMLEQDYVAKEKAKGLTPASTSLASVATDQEVGGVYNEVVREVLVPEIEKEINQGQSFTALRQIYNAVILAEWYKRNLKQSLLGKVYVGQSKIKGMDVEDKQISRKIYDQYMEALSKGVYNYIKEDQDVATGQTLPRKYFAGGVQLNNVGNVARTFDQRHPPAQGLEEPVGDKVGVRTVLAENADHGQADSLSHQAAVEDRLESVIQQSRDGRHILVGFDVDETLRQDRINGVDDAMIRKVIALAADLHGRGNVFIATGNKLNKLNEIMLARLHEIASKEKLLANGAVIYVIIRQSTALYAFKPMTGEYSQPFYEIEKVPGERIEEIEKDILLPIRQRIENSHAFLPMRDNQVIRLEGLQTGKYIGIQFSLLGAGSTDRDAQENFSNLDIGGQFRQKIAAEIDQALTAMGLGTLKAHVQGKSSIVIMSPTLANKDKGIEQLKLQVTEIEQKDAMVIFVDDKESTSIADLLIVVGENPIPIYGSKMVQAKQSDVAAIIPAIGRMVTRDSFVEGNEYNTARLAELELAQRREFELKSPHFGDIVHQHGDGITFFQTQTQFQGSTGLSQVGTLIASPESVVVDVQVLPNAQGNLEITDRVSNTRHFQPGLGQPRTTDTKIIRNSYLPFSESMAESLQNRPDAEAVTWLDFSNLFGNPNHVSFVRGRLYYPTGFSGGVAFRQDFSQPFFSFVQYPDGKFDFTYVRFEITETDRVDGYYDVVHAQAFAGTTPLPEEAVVFSAIPLVVDGRPADLPLAIRAGMFQDLRHLFALAPAKNSANAKPGDLVIDEVPVEIRAGVYWGFDELTANNYELAARAIEGPVTMSLVLNTSPTNKIPITPDQLKKILARDGYSEETDSDRIRGRNPEEGKYVIISDQEVVIFWKPAPYPHLLFGRTEAGNRFVQAIGGVSGRIGITIKEVYSYAQKLGVRDVMTISQGTGSLLGFVSSGSEHSPDALSKNYSVIVGASEGRQAGSGVLTLLGVEQPKGQRGKQRNSATSELEKRPEKQVAVFDVDGTLIDGLRPFINRVNAAMYVQMMTGVSPEASYDLGRQLTEQEKGYYDYALGLLTQWSREGKARSQQIALLVQEAGNNGAVLSAWDSAATIRFVDQTILANIPSSGVRLVVSAGEMLGALHARGVAIYLSSHMTESILTTVLGYFGIGQYVTRIRIPGVEDGAAKTEKLRGVIRASGASTDRVIFVGDEPADMTAAREVGIAGVRILLPSRDASKDGEGQPAASVTQVSKVPSVFDSIVAPSLPAPADAGEALRPVPVDVYAGFYGSFGMMARAPPGAQITEEAVGSFSLKFLTPDARILPPDQRRLNETWGVENQPYGVTEVYFVPEGDTQNRMAAFQAELKEKFGDKVYLVDQNRLHFTTQGLEQQWDDQEAGTKKPLALHSGLEQIESDSGEIQAVREQARSIETPAVKMQVARLNYNPRTGIFWELRPYLTDPALDPIKQRRQAWGLPEPRPPHVTAAYFTQPFTVQEEQQLRALLGKYRDVTYFGDIDVDNAQVIAYTNFAFNPSEYDQGYRVLETVPFKKESPAADQVPADAGVTVLPSPAERDPEPVLTQPQPAQQPVTMEELAEAEVLRVLRTSGNSDTGERRLTLEVRTPDNKTHVIKLYNNEKEFNNESFGYAVANRIGMHVPREQNVPARGVISELVEKAKKIQDIPDKYSGPYFWGRLVEPVRDFQAVHEGSGLEELVVFTYLMGFQDYLIIENNFFNLFLTDDQKYVVYDLANFWDDNGFLTFFNNYSFVAGQIDGERLVNAVRKALTLTPDNFSEFLSDDAQRDLFRGRVNKFLPEMIDELQYFREESPEANRLLAILEGQSFLPGEQVEESPDAPKLTQPQPAQQQQAQDMRPGGIDLNGANLDLQIKRDRNGIPLPVDQQPIQDMNIDGFVPVILNVTPVNLLMLLGLNTGESSPPAPKNAADDRQPFLDRKERQLVTARPKTS